MSESLTRNDIVTAVKQAIESGEVVNSYRLHDRVCRTDAVGRISKTDSEYFDRVLADMVAKGEVKQIGHCFICRTDR
jgi:hypothetical protein